MKALELNYSMMGRRWLGNALTVTLVGAMAAFLLLYPKLIEEAQGELEQAYDSISVSGWMVNAAGNDDPRMPIETYTALLASGFIGEHYDAAYAGYATMHEAIEGMAKIGGDISTLGNMEQRDYVAESLNKLLPASNRLYGVNAAEANATLFRIAQSIEWLEGYSNESFGGEEAILILPTSSGYGLGDTVDIILSRDDEMELPKEQRIRELFTFKVAGVYPTNSGAAYCPINALRAMLEGESKWGFSIRSFAFTLSDSRNASAFKDVLTRLGLDKNESLRAAVDDRILEGATSPIIKNIDLLTGLRPFLYGMVALMGFFLCFLLARGRKQEYAVMRLLGESRFCVTLKATLEQLTLCVLGLCAGAAAMLLLRDGGSWLDISVLGLIALCYCAGAALAAAIVVRVDVMSILRDKE